MVLNPDIDKVISVVKSIHENNGCCLSKLSYGELPQDTRCPFPEFMLYGKCECGLFASAPIVDPNKMNMKL